MGVGVRKLLKRGLIVLLIIRLLVLEHCIDLDRIFHVENQGPNGARLDLWRVSGETHQEHLEQLRSRLETGENLCHVREGFLSASPNLLVRVTNSADQLNDERS